MKSDWHDYSREIREYRRRMSWSNGFSILFMKGVSFDYLECLATSAKSVCQ